MRPAAQDPTVHAPRGGHDRPRRRALGIGAALSAMVVVGAAVLVAVNRSGGDGDARRLVATPGPTSTVDGASMSVAPATTSAPTPAAPATTSAPPTTVVRETLTTASRLRLDGIGPVAVGMTLDEASAAAGVRITSEDSEFYGPECSYARAEGGLHEDLAFMMTRGKIARIDVTYQGTKRIQTLSGIAKGSTEADVMKAYPGRIKVEGHPYVPAGHYLVYTAADPALAHLSLIFETDGAVVTSFRSGLVNQVSQIEGCL